MNLKCQDGPPCVKNHKSRKNEATKLVKIIFHCFYILNLKEATKNKM